MKSLEKSFGHLKASDHTAYLQHQGPKVAVEVQRVLYLLDVCQLAPQDRSFFQNAKMETEAQGWMTASAYRSHENLKPVFLVFLKVF